MSGNGGDKQQGSTPAAGAAGSGSAADDRAAGSGSAADDRAAAPLIRVDAVHKSFGSLQVLTGADLAVGKGESMVVIGGSGTGKSVLIKHIIGLLRPDAGTVTVDGQVVSELGRGELSKIRRRMGMLFQYAALFDSMTVAENVSFALRQHTRRSEAEIAVK